MTGTSREGKSRNSRGAMRRIIEQAFLATVSRLPNRLVRHLLFLTRQRPELTDAWGYHIRPIHYYDPVPDFRQITSTDLRRRREFPVIDFNFPAQLALIRRLAGAFGDELKVLATASEPEGFEFRNDYFAGFDAALCYGLVRELKPSRIVEIGSGYSTRIADQALRRNRTEGHSGEMTCIEPFPEPRLTDATLEITLIQQPVEAVDLDVFEDLQENDILFIDSSHVVKAGGDVCREFLDILPRLKAGVWIHIHDIFFPHDYPAEWVIEKRIAFNEQYLLEAFLAFNRGFAVRAANYWLCLDHIDEVAGLWPGVATDFRSGSPGCASFWMVRLP